MEAIRQLLLRQFSVGSRVREPNDELADALYAMLTRVNLDPIGAPSCVVVDGWTLFRVTQETNDCLAAVGLMTLLPSGSVPIAVSVKAHSDGLAWVAQVGREDDIWLAMSESKRWKCVYLHASGDLDEPLWTWGPTYQGICAARAANKSQEPTDEG